jgi:hypothetical protein
VILVDFRTFLTAATSIGAFWPLQPAKTLSGAD